MAVKTFIFYNSKTNTHGKASNIAQFCREYNLNENSFRDVITGRQIQHRGMYAKSVDSELDLYQRFIKHTTPVVSEQKTKKTIQQRYNQSDDWARFNSSVVEYYNEYHIKQEMTCGEIGKIFGVSGELIRVAFAKHGLKCKKYYRNKSGVDHAKFNHYDEEQKHFLDNFKLLFKELHNAQNLSVVEIAQKYRISPTTVFNYCRKTGIKYKRANVSTPHKILCDILDQYNIDYSVNNRSVITPKEIDIFIPCIKLGIEVNGVFWHSETKIGRRYHIDKHNRCAEKNVKLLQFFDDEIVQKIDICKSIIQQFIGKSEARVNGRDTECRRINDRDTREFLETNHIQGYRPASICYGLYYHDELISCMTFSRDRKYQYQLIRLVTRVGYTCIGGASKMFKRFITDYAPNTIVSYCDRRLFDGTVYNKLGFECTHVSNPNYYYFNLKDCKRMSRLAFQKHKLHTILPGYDSSKTEWENMKIHNYDRIWDCGNKVFVWTA